jgi:hypothetical protein
LVRRHTGAELILADNTAGAIDAIESHVPDLVLIPAFLSPEDDEALTNALRVTEAASHVQTLTIPVLGQPQQRSSALGMLSRLRRDSRPASPDSCDPKLFAEQISEYLERVAKERGPIAGTNGKGSFGSNGGGRRAETAAASTPPPAEKAKPAASSKPAAASKPVSPAPPPEPPPPAAHVDLSGLEAALSQVELGAPLPDVSIAAAETESGGADDLEGLERGLSSLMEKLTVEESNVPSATPAPVNATDWAKLKQLESVEYAMPSIAPRDENTAVDAAPSEASAATESAAAPAATATAPAPAGPQAEKKSEFGDLIDSLKKDLRR